jgi:hypothetical protein
MNTSFEKLVISAIMNDQGVHSSVIPDLKPDYFTTDREIIVKIQGMYQTGKAIDTYTLIAELPKLRDEILNISTLVASSANITTYIVWLKDNYMRSQMRVWFGVELGIGDDPFDYLNEKLQQLSDLRENVTGAKSYQRSLLASDFDGILRLSKIDPNDQIERPPTILSIKEVNFSSVTFKRIFTLGNFSCIIGKAKSRKTFLLTLLTASLLNPHANEKLTGLMPEGKKIILYFDTEQGEYDCYNTIKRIEKMAGNIGNLKGYSLRQFTPIERCQIIEYAFKQFGEEVGFCAIDGIADLANAINDEDEATRVTSILLRLTKIYGCHITTIIHQNKNDNFATGHLGSAIMKKAEILISVTKGKIKEVCQVNCDMSRGVDFEPFGMFIKDGLPVIGDITQIAEYKPSYHDASETKEKEHEKLILIPF